LGSGEGRLRQQRVEHGSHLQPGVAHIHGHSTANKPTWTSRQEPPWAERRGTELGQLEQLEQFEQLEQLGPHGRNRGAQTAGAPG
jgi:hypothetical protein